MGQSAIAVIHGHCMDGATCAAIVRRLYRKSEYVSGLHKQIDRQTLSAVSRLSEGGSLFIADICPSQSGLQKVCEALKKINGKLFLYEHHVTNEWLADYRLPEGIEGEKIYDLTRCGSRILYQAWQDREPEKLGDLDHLTELVNDRDLWHNKFPKSADMGMQHTILGDDGWVKRFTANPDPEFTHDENLILNYEKENLRKKTYRLIKTAKTGTDKDGYRYAVMVGEGMSSEICNSAIHELNLEYAVLFDYNSARASVRSRGNFNCAEFCQSRGGGGHPCAAGFPLPDPSFDLY